jgi:hypothetical protein
MCDFDRITALWPMSRSVLCWNFGQIMPGFGQVVFGVDQALVSSRIALFRLRSLLWLPVRAHMATYKLGRCYSSCYLNLCGLY